MRVPLHLLASCHTDILVFGTQRAFCSSGLNNTIRRMNALLHFKKTPHVKYSMLEREGKQKREVPRMQRLNQYALSIIAL